MTAPTPQAVEWPHRPTERRPQQETDARGDVIHEADHRLVCAADRSLWPCPSQQYLDAFALDVERLARALVKSDLMARYSDYALRAHPDRMAQEPLDELAAGWSERIAAEYARLNPK